MRMPMRIMLSGLALALTVALVPASAQAGRGSSYSQVMSAIQTGNADVIISELERAERLICVRCVEPVMALLDHDDYRIREVAAWWIARRPAQKAEIIDVATARLYGDDTLLARNAADALGTFRLRTSVPVLAYATARQDLAPAARAAAVRALGTISHPDGEPAVVAALADGAAEVRLEAVRAYWAMRGTRDGGALVTLLGDADASVRREAAAAVGRFRTPGARARLETLLASDEDELTRRNAAWSLGQVGDRASRPALDAAVAGDASSLVRSVAKASITRLR